MSTPELAGDSVRIEGLRKSFGPNLVLDGIDLSLDAHEVICLIGASGRVSPRCCAASTCWSPSTRGRSGWPDS